MRLFVFHPLLPRHTMEAIAIQTPIEANVPLGIRRNPLGTIPPPSPIKQHLHVPNLSINVDGIIPTALVAVTDGSAHLNTPVLGHLHISIISICSVVNLVRAGGLEPPKIQILSLTRLPITSRPHFLLCLYHSTILISCQVVPRAGLEPAELRV